MYNQKQYYEDLSVTECSHLYLIKYLQITPKNVNLQALHFYGYILQPWHPGFLTCPYSKAS